MNGPNSMPALMEVFAGGDGPDIICALIDSIEAYGVYMAKSNIAASDTDSSNIYYLTRLLRAIISDCCGINIH